MKRSRRWYLIGGGLIVAGLLLVAIFAAKITPVSPDYWDAKSSVLDGVPPFPPGPGHLLGTDDYGRDIWSRVVYGTRWSLFFGALVMAARMLIAVPMAVLCAYGPKRVGWLVDKLYVMTSAVPPLLIYLLLLSHQGLRTIGLWPSVVLTASLLALVEWPRVAVVLKGRMDQLSAEPFVEGAVASGGTRWEIFRTHLLPHLWPTLLHLMAAEMARALLMIAQLGIFGILFGGGVLIVIDNGHGGDKWILTTGIPEWSSLLSDGRYYILSRPWIPFPPAVAFLTAVTGFTVLSQGLEGFNLSIGRIKERTTGLLSRRWRWALLAVPAVAILWYYQGLPWDRMSGLQAVANRQAAALTAHDLDGYLATIDPKEPGARADGHLQAAALTNTPFELIGATLSDIDMKGAHATAFLTLNVGYKEKQPTSIMRRVTFVRRWGTWYVGDEGYRDLRGYQVDVSAYFDPLDPTPHATPVRQQVYYVTTAADHAYAQVAPFFPGALGKTRPQVRFYQTDRLFRMAVGDVAPETSGALYLPGDPLRISPDYLKGFKRWETERMLGYELVKYLSYTVLHQTTVDPVAMGRYELTTSGDRIYEPEYRKLAGAPLMPMETLFATPVDGLDPDKQLIFAAESAELVRYLQDRLPESELAGPALGKAWTLAALAERLGKEPKALAAEYDGYFQQRMAATSILNVPAALSRIPNGLTDGIANRAQAALRGDEAQFMRMTEPQHQGAWTKWLSTARQEGLTAYDATMLDWDDKSSTAWVLERIQLGDGKVVSGVVQQNWTQKDGTWVAGAVVSPLQIP